MLDSITAKQLSEWMRYAKEEPFGELRADLRAGIIASTVANVHRGKGQPLKPQDFMPFTEKPKWTRKQFEAAFSDRIVKNG